MNRNAILASAVAVVVASLSGCAEDPFPFDPARMQHNARKSAQTLTTRPMYPLPTTLDTTYIPREPGRPVTRLSNVPTTGPALNEDPVLRLSLQEVLHRAINNNLDIRISGYDPGINSNRVTEAQAKFDPTLFFSPYYEWRHFQANPAFLPAGTAGSEQISEFFGTSAGIRQPLETGGTAELRHETFWIHQFSPPTFNADGSQTDYPGYFTNNLVAELKQPLLKNFGTDVTRAQITVAKNDQRISVLEFRKQVEDSLFNTEQAYWQLLEALQEVDINEKLLQASVDTAEVLAKRTLQDVTRVELSQANSAVQSRKAFLVRSRSRVRDFSDQLKRLMNDPELPVASNILVLPSTDALRQPIHFDPQDQINQGIEHRFELAEQVLKIDSASVIVRVAKNNLLPTLDVQNTMTVNGAGENWDDANSSLKGGKYASDRLGLSFEVPIGNRQARAIYRRTLLQRQQTIDAYRNVIEQVSLEVKTALRNVETTWNEIATNHQAVLANADALNAILVRERNKEPLTYSFVQLKLDTQNRLADAERAEAQAVAGYCIAIASLERAKGTLMRYDNVLMEEDRMDIISRVKVREDMPEPMQLMPARLTGVDASSAPGMSASPMNTLRDIQR